MLLTKKQGAAATENGNRFCGSITPIRLVSGRIIKYHKAGLLPICCAKRAASVLHRTIIRQRQPTCIFALFDSQRSSISPSIALTLALCTRRGHQDAHFVEDPAPRSTAEDDAMLQT